MLQVAFGTVNNNAKARWPDDGRQAWRVRYVREVDGDLFSRAIPMQFARQQDAMAAMKAIESMVDWSQPYEVLVMQLDFNLMRQRMVEAMAW